MAQTKKTKRPVHAKKIKTHMQNACEKAADFLAVNSEMPFSSKGTKQYYKLQDFACDSEYSVQGTYMVAIKYLEALEDDFYAEYKQQQKQIVKWQREYERCNDSLNKAFAKVNDLNKLSVK